MISNRAIQRAALTGFAALVALASPLAAQDAAKPDLTEVLDTRSNFEDGKAVWDKVCARCHTTEGVAGGFSVGPDLSLNEYDADTLRFFVRNGYLAMPAFPASAISDASLDDLTAYIAANVHKGDK